MAIRGALLGQKEGVGKLVSDQNVFISLSYFDKFRKVYFLKFSIDLKPIEINYFIVFLHFFTTISTTEQ